MQKNRIYFILVAVALLACLLVGCGSKTAYDQLCTDGYQGTPEELIAALVGEQTAPGIEKTAYCIACESGYRGNFEQWTQTLVGVAVSDETVPVYTAACEKGCVSTFPEWLESLVPKPEALGKGGEEKSPYELACEYGFEGTYSEWMVSLANDNIKN